MYGIFSGEQGHIRKKTIFRPLPDTTDQRAVHKKGILTTLRHGIPPPSLSNSRYPSASRSILAGHPGPTTGHGQHPDCADTFPFSTFFGEAAIRRYIVLKAIYRLALMPKGNELLANQTTISNHNSTLQKQKPASNCWHKSRIQKEKKKASAIPKQLTQEQPEACSKGEDHGNSYQIIGNHTAAGACFPHYLDPPSGTGRKQSAHKPGSGRSTAATIQKYTIGKSARCRGQGHPCISRRSSREVSLSAVNSAREH